MKIFDSSAGVVGNHNRVKSESPVETKEGRSAALSLVASALHRLRLSSAPSTAQRSNQTPAFMARYKWRESCGRVTEGRE